ncbi:MAG: UDP-N-acetylglucosamine 1-carboxyvinyltransferase [Lachnospiraceae bacterium]
MILVNESGMLKGKIAIQGSKNAALPIMAASILVDGITILHNCPMITDVFDMIRLLEELCCTVKVEKNSIYIDARNCKLVDVSKEFVTKMRSSVMLLGPILGRLQKVTMAYPGGCVIGDRPIDIHINALKLLNVCITCEEEEYMATTNGLKGNEIVLPFPSVGATENCIMAAVLAKGVTVLKNVAIEPEVIALCEFLNCTGACICGIGTKILRIKGVSKLSSIEYTIPPDRIVLGTYMHAVVGCTGCVCFENVVEEDNDATFQIIEDMGANIKKYENKIVVTMKNKPRAIPYLETSIFPGYPTDLQSTLIATLTRAQGKSCIVETIFNNRFQMIEELVKMGANIKIEHCKAKVIGTDRLFGKEVIATDLRAGAGLVIAGLYAEGCTIIHNTKYIKRGYEDIVRDLSSIGAKVKWQES